MSYLVLARKWRPQRFEDIAGQAHITKTLQNAIQSNRIAHAYLFTGVRGVGKTTAARILAKALNCQRGPTAEPCNQCDNCTEITAGNCIDVLEIDGASNRGIDEIRQIIDNVRYQPAKCRFKIYIIDEVHQVTKDAFNALLKTLEEPPPSVKFILATTEPHRLPETILSRCQRYDFRRIALREIAASLDAIARQEGVELNERALALLAREADGSMRDAQSLLEQVVACVELGEKKNGKSKPVKVDEDLLQSVLGLAARQVLYDISSAVLAGDGKRCLELVAAVVAQGWDLNRLSRDLVEHFRNLLVARLAYGAPARPTQANDGSAELLDLPSEEIDALVHQVTPVSTDALLDYFEYMNSGDEAVSRSATPRFTLETVLVRLATLPQSLPVNELLDRLERLEQRGGAPARDIPPSVAPAATPAIASTPKAVTPVKPIAAPPPSPRQAGGAGWDDFVAFVGTTKKFLGSHLATAKVLEMDGAGLRLGVAEGHHLAYLQDGENLAALKALAKEFFARELAIQLVATAAVRDGAANSPYDRADEASPERSEMVKEALRIFGGSVRSVRRES